MYRQFLFLLFAACCFSCQKTQVPTNMVSTSGIHFYGTSGDLILAGMSKTTDGGFVFCGHALPSSTQPNAGFLIKTKANGEVEWQKLFGGPSPNAFAAARQTSDGGYIAVGYTASIGLGALRKDYFTDAWMMKTDSKGNKQWEKTFGAIYQDSFLDVMETNQGFVAVGITCDKDSAYFYQYINQAYVVKTDLGGTPLWSHEYFIEKDYSEAETMTIDINGNIDIGCIAIKSDSVIDQGTYYPAFLSISPDGKKTLAKQFFLGPKSVTRERIISLPGGLALGCNLNQNSLNSPYIIRTDFLGNILWQKNLGPGIAFSDLVAQPSGGCNVVCTSYASGTAPAPEWINMDASGTPGAKVICNNSNGTSVSSTISPTLTTIDAIPVNNGWAIALALAPTFKIDNGKFALMFTDQNGKIIDNIK